MTTNQRAIKCPGRFSELREHLHNEAVPLVLEDKTDVHESSLREMWDLVRDEVFRFDVKDPYYTQPEAKKDSLRKEPNLDYLSLVPLFPSTFHFADNWSQLGKDFVCQWDSSAKKLGYVGSRSGHYIKEL